MEPLERYALLEALAESEAGTSAPDVALVDGDPPSHFPAPTAAASRVKMRCKA
jgi:hypothetical protein